MMCYFITHDPKKIMDAINKTRCYGSVGPPERYLGANIKMPVRWRQFKIHVDLHIYRYTVLE